MATIDELLTKAEELFRKKNYQGVIDLLPEEVLEEHKSDDLYIEKARAYSRLKEYDLCLKAAEKALVINPNNANAHNNIGIVYDERGQYEKAVEEYNKAIACNPKISYPYYNLGLVYYSLKQYEKAIEAFNKAIKIGPKDSFHYYGLGNVYRELKQCDKAIESYNEAIKIDPKYSSPYNGLGNSYYDLKQYDKAIEAYNEAIKIDPKNHTPYYGLGNAYLNLKQYDKAIEAYNEAIKINPKYSSPYNGLGNSYYDLKKYDKAIEAYNDAIKIAPTGSAPYYNRALVYFDQGQYKKSLLDFEKKIELTKDNPDYYTSLAKEKIAEIGKLINDQAYSDINILVNKVKDVLLYKDDCITHYTTMTVAKALILDKSKLRLSEGAYLNDTSEGRELFKYLHLTATPIDGHDTIAEPFAKKPFIGSFVAESKHDDLTLWRMYGKEAKEEARGCSITMRRDELITKITESLPGYKKEDASKADSEFIFYRVAYRKQDNEKPFTIPSGKPKDENLLNRYMKELAISVKDFEEKRVGNIADKQKLLELLNEIAFLFKSYDYQYEHEIRLVLKGTGFEKNVDMAFTPPKVYIELINIRPVLKKITLGPKVEKSDEWASALFYSLDKEGLNPEILISHLPFK